MKYRRVSFFLSAIAALALLAGPPAEAQNPTPSVVDRNLAVRTAAGGFVTPVNLAFIGPRDMFVLEKNTGKVQRVVNGAIQGAVLDLARSCC